MKMTILLKCYGIFGFVGIIEDGTCELITTGAVFRHHSLNDLGIRGGLAG